MFYTYSSDRAQSSVYAENSQKDLTADRRPELRSWFTQQTK